MKKEIEHNQLRERKDEFTRNFSSLEMFKLDLEVMLKAFEGF